MKHVALKSALTLLLAACASDAPAPFGHAGTGLRVEMGALTYPGAADVCYAFAVTSPSGELVVGRGGSHTDPTRHPGGTLSYDLAPGYTDPLPGGVCSTRFGDGPGGAWSYVAPCDASTQGSHLVTVWLDALTLEGDLLATPGLDYQDPCPTGCTLQATCQENADTPVAFNFTIMRRAQQGFFDIGVNFDNIFCSAKVDCVDEGGEPLELLHHPESGGRGQTAVLGLACSAGPGAEDTVILRDPITITCGEEVWLLDPAQPEGVVYTHEDGDNPAPAGSPVWQYAVYAGQEALPCGAASCNKTYWNVAIGFDPGAVGCRLATTATAGPASALSDLSTPEASTWPLIEVDLELTDGDGELACARHPLNGDLPGVSTSYTGIAETRSFGFRFDGQPFSELSHPLLAVPLAGLVFLVDASIPASYPGSGQTWFDLGDDGHAGALEGSTFFSADDGGAMVLNGTTDNINFGDILDMGLDDMTVNIWLRVEATWSGDDRFVLSKAHWGPGNFRYAIGLDNQRRPNVLCVGAANTHVWPRSTAPLGLGQWHMLSVVFKRDAAITAFLDGLPIPWTGSADISAPVFSEHSFDSIHPLRIGAYSAVGSHEPMHFFPGRVAHTSVYRRALSPDEVLQIHASLSGRFLP